jgi:pilus assembly protein CpaE
MTSTAALKPEPAPIVACTISRNVQNFDLLIEDMESELGESWGDLTFEDAGLFLRQPDSDGLEFVAIAMAEDDETEIANIAEIIKAAVAKKIKVLVIAEEVSPIALHQLLKLGAQEFVPYPLPDGALRDAIDRMRRAPAALEAIVGGKTKAGGDRNGVVLPIQGLAGGTGATTFAVNLAWELANIDKDGSVRVCLLDLDLQFGSTSTYLDLPRREAVLELLSDTAAVDNDSFMQALLTFQDKLHVLTAPAEMLPLDMIGQEDVDRILKFARSNFDYVVIDMPSSVVSWSETVLNASHVFFSMLELDMRSAQNTLRLLRALKAEELPYERLRFILNRAPGFTDVTGKSRVKRLAESLDIKIEVQMPDGGKVIRDACDQGLPLAQSAAKSPLRKEIQKLAQSIHELNVSAAAAT